MGATANTVVESGTKCMPASAPQHNRPCGCTATTDVSLICTMLQGNHSCQGIEENIFLRADLGIIFPWCIYCKVREMHIELGNNNRALGMDNKTPMHKIGSIQIHKNVNRASRQM